MNDGLGFEYEQIWNVTYDQDSLTVTNYNYAFSVMSNCNTSYGRLTYKAVQENYCTLSHGECRP